MGRPTARGSRPDRERRRYSRYRPRSVYDVRAMGLAEHGLEQPASRPVVAHIHDIGAGGLGLVSNEALTVHQLLRCEIVLPGVRAGVPTLVRVRWCAKAPRRVGYRAGVEFLLG